MNKLNSFGYAVRSAFLVMLMCWMPQVFAGASTGNSLKKAVSISVGATKSVKLVNEWDGDDYTDSGVYYLKVKLSKYDSCTVSAKGTGDISLMVDTDPEDDNAPWAGFDYLTSGTTQYATLSSSSWDDEDPGSAYFYISVSGDIGDSATVSVSSGVSLPVGIAENPKVISVTDAKQSASGTFNDGDYYFSAKLTAGRKYLFSTRGGTTNGVYTLDFPTEDGVDCQVYDDLSNTDTNNAMVIVFPSVTASYTIVIGTDGADAAFTMDYRSIPARPIASHPVVELNEANGYAATIKPGYKNADPENYYDDIVDEELCKADLEAGKNYVVKTTGATTNLVLYVYNATGTRVGALNYGRGDGSYDVFAALEAGTTEGTYYFGVCQNMDELEGLETPVRNPVEISLEEVDLAVDEVVDLFSFPGSKDDFAENVDVEGVGPITLDETHWSQTFALSARSGVTYRLAVTSEATTDLTLDAAVYTLNGTTKRAFTGVSGSLSGKNGLTIVPTANAVYYVTVTVAEGKGLKYPQFKMHAMGYRVGWELGILTVNAKGASGNWSIGSESVKYPAGASILAYGTVTVKFEAIKGYSQPFGTAGTTVEVVPGSKPTVVTGIYSDTFDPKDDVAAGATALTPSAKEVEAGRTLFAEDAYDCFTFTPKAGTYYNFALDVAEGDAVFAITNAIDGVLVENAASISKFQFTNTAKQYLVVGHAETPAVDGSYKLLYSSANVGTLKFAKTALSVKEDAAYADLTVNRSAKEGRVRVAFGTVAGTAQPGREYYPTNGILEWAANDSKAKTIRVRLIPDVSPIFESNKMFSVALKPVEELEADEYPAAITTPEATITLTEVSKKGPGSIEVTAYDDGGSTLAVADPKKVVASVTAGETLSLSVARKNGADGVVGVLVTVAKGTAVPGTDFELVSTNRLIWADGETTVQTVEISTVSAEGRGSYAASKAFTVKLAALTGKDLNGMAFDKPTVSSGSISVTIKSDVVKQTLEDYVKALPKTAGITVKGGKSGMWFIDEMGELRSVPLAANASLDLSYSLTGPGFFMATPGFADEAGGAYVTCIAGKTNLGNVGDQDVGVMLGSGAQTVKFTFTAGPKAGTLDAEGTILETYGTFATYEKADETKASYLWIPLSGVGAEEPANKSTVVIEKQKSLTWSVPADIKDVEGVYYRVTLAANSKMLGSTNALLYAVGTDTTVAIPEGLLAAGTAYSWRVDFAYDSDDDGAIADSEWVVPKTVWQFTAIADGKDVPSCSVFSGYDANGETISPGATVELVQGVKKEFTLGVSNFVQTVSWAIADGKLPDGLKLDAAKGVVSGVPTKVGEYTALFQAKNGKLAGPTLRLTFNVSSISMAVGTFSGVVSEDGSALTNNLPKIGSLTFTATDAGKLSAKVTVGGSTYSFSAAGYDAVVVNEVEGNPETDYRELSAMLESVQKVGTVAYTNTLELSVIDAQTNNAAVVASPNATVRLTMAIVDSTKKAAQEEIVYVGNLYRDNTKVASALATVAEFAGYYTLALTPSIVSGEAPEGNGYLTITVDAKGKAKVAGALADGTTVSASAIASPVGVAGESGASNLVIPVFAGKSPYCFGGEIVLRAVDSGNGEIVVDSELPLGWYSDSAATTPSGEDGWSVEIEPVGGWYDTVNNLQAYYLNYTFLLDVSDVLPEELLPTGYSFCADCSPKDMSVDVVGDTISVAKKSLVKETGSKTVNNLSASVNPWNVSLTFKRATGLVNGSFSLWSEGYDAKGNLVQKEITGLKHAGVLLLSRDVKSSLPDSVWTAGYCLLPYSVKEGTKTRKVTESRPFNIKAVDHGEIDWWEDDWGELPEAE